MTSDTQRSELLFGLEAFIESVASGNFYQDYDASCELLGKARLAFHALSTPPKVGSGELDAAGLVERLTKPHRQIHRHTGALVEKSSPAIQHEAAGVIRLLLQKLNRGSSLATAFLRYFNPNDLPEDSSMQWQQLEHWAKTALAAPVDHPEVVGGMEGMVYAPNVMTALAAAHEAVRNAEREAERLRLALAKIADYSPDSRVQPALIARSALLPSDSPALEAGVAEGLRDQIDAAREFVKRHPSLTLIDLAEFEAFLKVPAAMTAALAALSIPAKEDGK